jgi:class 3 adenylate cyclase/tetratricopeptide (TPR) repeat protein
MAQVIAKWLERLGLGKYTTVFAENDIDVRALRHLTDEDLKSLGISLGHRRILLEAIAELPSSYPEDPSDAPQEPLGAGAATPAQLPERRQVTVLFSDLVGSTELAHRMDPEDLRELIRGYQDAVAGVVARYGGYVANFLGDGIVAYFGWPRADEDQAVQAVRAGLAVVAAVPLVKVDGAPQLHARVGIASGEVVVGDLESAGAKQVGAISGETPNLAARIQATADKDEVVIAGLTRQLIGAAFELDVLGDKTLKGIAGTVPLWRVLRERSLETRFEARGGQLTAFVGREHEVALLLERWQRVVAREGQLVLLSGDAGIGKSRIVQTLRERLANTPHRRVRLQCSPYHTASALHPLIAHLEHAAGFVADDPIDCRLEKLEALLRQGTNNIASVTSLIAELLSLPTEARYGTLQLTPQQRKEETLNALIEQVIGVAAREPVLIVLEDAHWIDPTTRELIGKTIDRITGHPVLLLVTYRPEFEPEWARHPYATVLTVNRLSQRQGAEVVRAVPGGHRLPGSVVSDIVRRTDGVPLYLEELTRSMVEAGSSSSATQIPETLHGSLLARLDRLGADAKEVAQIAATIGREFDQKLLGMLADEAEDKVALALDRLVASQIVLPGASLRRGAYLFRHALIQEAAYQSLLLSRRRQYHKRIAEILESHFPEIAAGQPELIAQHYTASELSARAMPYWLSAARRALAQYANLEAIAHAQRGLEHSPAVSALPETTALTIDLTLVLGNAQRRASQLGEAMATFERAAGVARKHNSPKHLARAALGYEEAEFFFGASGASSGPLLEEALSTLEPDDAVERCQVLCRLGRVYFANSQVELANKTARDAMAMARRLGDKEGLFDALVSLLMTKLGAPADERELRLRREALDEKLSVAEELRDADKLFRALSMRVASFIEFGDRAALDASFAQFAAMRDLVRFPIHKWVLACQRAMLAILQGEFSEAESYAEAGLVAGQDVQAENAAGVYGMQMFTIRREQGRLAEIAPLLKRFVDNNPDEAVWRPGLIAVATDLGHLEMARRNFDEIADAGFRLPMDAKRSATLSYLAEACVALGDTRRAETLYRLLLPYHRVTITVGVATICCGAAARFLGMLASLMGDWQTAEEHFEAAIAMNTDLHAWPWLAHVEHDYAYMLRRCGRQSELARTDRLISDALATASRLGMIALETRIHRELS